MTGLIEQRSFSSSDEAVAFVCGRSRSRVYDHTSENRVDFSTLLFGFLGIAVVVSMLLFGVNNAFGDWGHSRASLATPTPTPAPVAVGVASGCVLFCHGCDSASVSRLQALNPGCDVRP